MKFLLLIPLLLAASLKQERCQLTVNPIVDTKVFLDSSGKQIRISGVILLRNGCSNNTFEIIPSGRGYAFFDAQKFPYLESYKRTALFFKSQYPSKSDFVHLVISSKDKNKNVTTSNIQIDLRDSSLIKNSSYFSAKVDNNALKSSMNNWQHYLMADSNSSTGYRIEGFLEVTNSTLQGIQLLEINLESTQLKNGQVNLKKSFGQDKIAANSSSIFEYSAELTQPPIGNITFNWSISTHKNSTPLKLSNNLLISEFKKLE